MKPPARQKTANVSIDESSDIHTFFEIITFSSIQTPPFWYLFLC